MWTRARRCTATSGSHAGAKVIRSELRGPVAIGPDAVIEDSAVGPNVSVERDVRIMRSSVEDSIIMEGCQIVDVHGLATSILGRNVEVLHSGTGGRAPSGRRRPEPRRAVLSLR
jgi:glucose-1-phosphate thymidylyltransferase